jgi:hypothetical protein
MFTLILSDRIIYNQKEFLDFLITSQKNPIKISTNSEGACLSAYGVYELIEQFEYSDVTIYTSNMLELHNRYTIKKQHEFVWFNIKKCDYADSHMWNQTKIFGCFYNRPTWYRIGLAANLEYNFKEISLINFRRDPIDENQRKFFDVNRLFKYHPDSFKLFSQVVDRWPCKLENHNNFRVGTSTDTLTTQLSSFYKDFLIDIVAETWVEGTTFAPTEKTVRPMLLKKPFIIFASQDYLCYLRQLGFKTFQTPESTFWSEDYDGYEGRERYIRILALIDELAKKSKEELEEMYLAMQPILDHNYNLLVTQSYNKTITKITE